jgi:FKBP-type peptidyl-prolyl cis-trans isomerase
MNRALRRAAPVALAAAAAALLLAGCAGDPAPKASETPEASDCMELESGSLSDGVTVAGDFGGTPTATFTLPLTAESLERTVAIEGDGDVTAAGDQVSAIVSAFSGTTGEKVFSQPATITAGDDTVFQGFLAGIDCVPTGSRTVTVAPASTLYGDKGNETIGVAPGETLVIVVDVQEPLKPAEWKTDVPEVKFGAEGEAPTVTLPATPPPTEYQLKVLEKGDGDTVAAGDTVTLQYQGTSWDTGKVFDQSYGGDPAQFATDQVIQGFGAALVGQKVGTKLIVTIPPQYAYGTDPAAHDLGGQTLVFLVEIQGTAPTAPAAQ